MFQLKSLRVAMCLAVVLFCLSSSFNCSTVSAQTDESVEKLKAKVFELTKQTKYLEALPLLEKLVVAEPNDARMHFYLGFALIARANNTTDVAQRIALSKRARAAFVRAKELNIELLYLPPYSPNLNLIERLWRFVKKQVLYSKHYDRFDTFRNSINTCISDLGTRFKNEMQSLMTLKFQLF